MKLFENETLKSELDKTREELSYLRNENGKLREEVSYLRISLAHKSEEVIKKNIRTKEDIERLLKSLEEKYNGYFMTLEGQRLKVITDTKFEKSFARTSEIKICRISIPRSDFVYVEDN